MASLFHFVPQRMVGTVLYPLNTLKKREPEAWRREVAKYEGRERVLEKPIPPLGCLWNDVLHFSTVHPSNVVAELKAVGLEPLRRSFFELDAATLDPERTVIFLNRRSRGSARIDESQWLPFDTTSLAGLTQLTEPTRLYYRECAALGRRPLLYGYLPHVLFRARWRPGSCPCTRSEASPRPFGHVRSGQYGPPMRLIVARCEVTYTGRLSAHLPESTRLLMLKSDGSVLVHADAGGYKPLNWMTPPTVVEENDGVIVVRKRAGKTEDRLEIGLHEVLSDVCHDMGEAAALEKDGVERHLQEELAAQPEALEEGLRLVRREWPTDVGPVDLMCRDAEDGWVAVEIKRVATIDAVEQLSRYLERIRLDSGLAECRGMLAAEQLKPQAVTLADARGIGCVRVDLAVLRGEREPELTLFS